jgi:hypothetical protein
VALAILEPDDGPGDGPGDSGTNARWFRYDIGTSRFFRLAVGGPERRRANGVSLIDQPVYITPLQGPIPPSAMGRGRIAIGEEHFTREAEFVQMMSYRTAQREGPAVSAIIRARRPLPGHAAMPALTPPRLPVPMSVQPSRRPQHGTIANQMSFFDILRGLVPAIGSLLGGLAGGGGGAAAAPAPGGAAAPGGDILARLADPATIRLLTQLVSQIGGLPAAPAPTATPPATAASLSYVGAQGYSQAMIAPALLAALPALMPLLQQVLNPQTIQTLIDAPNRAAQTVINGVNDVLKIGVQADQNFMDHLRQLNPGVDDPALDRLLEGMGLSLSMGNRGNGRGREQDFVRTSRVRLAFAGLQSVTVAGENRILFASDHALSLPMTVELPMLRSGKVPRLHEPELLLEVKDPVTLRVHRRTRTGLNPIVGSGPIGAVTLPADAVAALEPGRDWLLCVTLTWKAPSKAGAKRLGAVMSSLIHLAGPLVFDGIADEGEAIDLSDPDEHRAVWHRLWAGRFEPEAKRFDAEVDYSYEWDPAASEAARRDTSIRTRPAEASVASVSARVKGGLALTPAVLSQIAASLDPGVPPLDPAAQIALADPAATARLGLGARVRLKLRGREGEAFALWAYPAVRRATLTLSAPDRILDTGNIASLTPSPVPFVVPVAINLLGTRAR